MTNQMNAVPLNPIGSHADIKEVAIITLEPKKDIFIKLREISSQMLGVSVSELNSFLDIECLESHTVPVCIPLFSHPDKLYQFIENNSARLIDFMLTAWPFPLEKWGFANKNIELLNQFVNVKYYPIMCKAIAKSVSSTLELAVTLATPTDELRNYILESIAAKKIVLSEEELTQMEFVLSAGIAIVTNQLEQSEDKDKMNIYLAINDSKNYLTPLKENIVKTLFYFYFKNKENFPPEIDNKYLNKWFNTKTFMGLYVFAEAGGFVS